MREITKSVFFFDSALVVSAARPSSSFLLHSRRLALFTAHDTAGGLMSTQSRPAASAPRHFFHEGNNTTLRPSSGSLPLFFLPDRFPPSLPPLLSLSLLRSTGRARSAQTSGISPSSCPCCATRSRTTALPSSCSPTPCPTASRSGWPASRSLSSATSGASAKVRGTALGADARRGGAASGSPCCFLRSLLSFFLSPLLVCSPPSPLPIALRPSRPLLAPGRGQPAVPLTHRAAHLPLPLLSRRRPKRHSDMSDHSVHFAAMIRQRS